MPLDDTSTRNGTVIGRLAYPQLFEPRRFGQTRTDPGTGDPKYSCSIVAYDKFAAPMRDAITLAMKTVVDETYPDLKKLPPRGLRGVKKDPILKAVAEYPAMWAEAPDDAIFCRMASTDMPGFFDAQVQPLTLDAAKLLLVNGCFVRAAFRAYHYTQGGDPGISLALLYVQFLRPGKAFISKPEAGTLLKPTDSEDMFAGIEGAI